MEHEKTNYSLGEYNLNAGLSPAVLFDSIERQAKIKAVLKTLTPIEERVIKYHFGFYGKILTLKEIGEELKISGSAVGNAKNKALRKLRHSSRSRNLRPFVGLDEYEAKKIAKGLKNYNPPIIGKKKIMEWGAIMCLILRILKTKKINKNSS